RWRGRPRGRSSRRPLRGPSWAASRRWSLPRGRAAPDLFAHHRTRSACRQASHLQACARRRLLSRFPVYAGKFESLSPMERKSRRITNRASGVAPVVGMFSNAITAIALTEFLARWHDEYILHPETPPPDVTMAGMKEIFASALKKKKKEEAS